MLGHDGSGPLLWQSIDYSLRSARDRADLDRLAATAGYSRFHFSRLIHRTTGLSLATYLGHLRIQKARWLLAVTRMSITDVALAVGFSSVGTFGRRFHSLTGLSPGAFRHYVHEGHRQPASPLGDGEVSGEITCPSPFVGWVHVGLFLTPQPFGFPVAQAVLAGPGSFCITNVPCGEYHAAAVACCCHPAYSGDVSGAWAIGHAEVRPVLASPGDRVGGVDIHLVERLPVAPPLLAVFAEGSNDGEAVLQSHGLRCGLGGLYHEGADSMALGVASVVVYVSDMDRAVDFYRRLLGSDVAHRNPTVETFVADGLRLILHRDKLPTRAGVRGAMEFNLEVPDANAFHAAMRLRGIQADPPTELPWGWVGFSVNDPDGNVVEIYEVPK